MNQDEMMAALDKSIQARKELEQEVERLRERVAELEQVVDTDMDALTYEQMTKKDKVREIRAYLVREATSSANGGAALTYDNVQALFNGRPSPGHAYDLMQVAATAEGFNYDQFDGDRTNRITVNLDGVKDVDRFHAANKEEAV